MALSGWSQSGTNSPYSQFGIGILSDQSQGPNRGMGGVGIALRNGNRVNALNPASYSATDSLSMVIDAGISGQVTNFKEGGRKINVYNSCLEYVTAAFRVAPHVGASVGFLPLSNIGYDYSSSSPINDVACSGISNTTIAEKHSGTGGLHQAYLGIGWNIYKQFSVGMNFSYLWGSYNKSIVAQSSDAYVSTVTKLYSASVSSYKFDFGIQWEQPISKKDIIMVGATLGLGHNLGAEPQCIMSNTDSQTGVSNIDTLSIKDGLEIPMTLGFGLSWHHNKRYIVALDYSLQKWDGLKFPVAGGSNGRNSYVLRDDQFCNRHKIAIGGEWTPNPISQKYYNRINYRVGVSLATPYCKINGVNGPKEYSVSAGFGLPIMNTYNNRSVLNISGQWVHQALPGMISENMFRINLGLTFNERWFAKWKFN